jgi:hypothetical protein
MGKPTSYYKRGDWLAICDVCGFRYNATELRLRWDGLRVCPKDFEVRQPQDFVRGVKDIQAPPWTRTPPEDISPPGALCTMQARLSIAGFSVPGCWIIGRRLFPDPIQFPTPWKGSQDYVNFADRIVLVWTARSPFDDSIAFSDNFAITGKTTAFTLADSAAFTDALAFTFGKQLHDALLHFDDVFTDAHFDLDVDDEIIFQDPDAGPDRTHGIFINEFIAFTDTCTPQKGALVVDALALASAGMVRDQSYVNMSYILQDYVGQVRNF